MSHGPCRVRRSAPSRRRSTLDAAGKDAEVCLAGERLQAAFGREPKLLRPPYGAVDGEVRLAAKACGVKALITWARRGPPGCSRRPSCRTWRRRGCSGARLRVRGGPWCSRPGRGGGPPGGRC
ncbi:polysaccharide deacetylase family protein [Streptomyces sp. NPDC089795]|uniref:polysaccharide deacetylase family protein n=1 Tax=Streptomyces sp. NPDC089795 TaxID=3155297 RepID=UPI00341A8744